MTETALEIFRPTSVQEEFFLRIQRGDPQILFADDHRTGKTICGAMAVASMFLDRDIVFAGGQRVSLRPRAWRHGPLDIVVIGNAWNDIGHLCRVLFEPRVSNNRVQPEIISRQSLSNIQWRDKEYGQLSECTGHDGSRLLFFSSLGSTCGYTPHCIWIDEELQDETAFDELQCRLLDFNGSMIRTIYRDPAQ